MLGSNLTMSNLCLKCPLILPTCHNELHSIILSAAATLSRAAAQLRDWTLLGQCWLQLTHHSATARDEEVITNAESSHSDSLHLFRDSLKKECLVITR